MSLSNEHCLTSVTLSNRDMTGRKEMVTVWGRIGNEGNHKTGQGRWRKNEYLPIIPFPND